MKLLPLDSPGLIGIVAGWLSREEHYKWLDFGEGPQPLSAVSLKIMTQRDRHVLRVFTADDSDLPLGLVGLSDVHREARIAGSAWGVLGCREAVKYVCRAASKLLTYGFTELGLEAVAAWTVEPNSTARRILEQLHFRYSGRLRGCHWIDGRSYDRLLYDLLASEHRELPDGWRWSSRAPRILRPPVSGPLTTLPPHPRRAPPHPADPGR